MSEGVTDLWMLSFALADIAVDHNRVRTRDFFSGTFDDSAVSAELHTGFVGKDGLGIKASSPSKIHKAMSAVDDDIVECLVNACRQNAADCTDDEIVHFVHHKGAMVRIKESRIYSPIGFLLTAVPKCFAGEAFRLYREAEGKRREEEAAAEAQRQAELAA